VGFPSASNATPGGNASPVSGGKQYFPLVGKLFPTVDPNHSEPLRTAHFITQEDIGGFYSTASGAGLIVPKKLCRKAWRRGIQELRSVPPLQIRFLQSGGRADP
jgi:hypothetical protein